MERLVEHLAGLAELDTQHHQRTVMDIPSLPHPRHFQTVDDVAGSQHLGIDDAADAHFVEEFLVLRIHILRTVDLGNGLLRTQRLRQSTCRHIIALIGRDGDEEVSILHPCLFQTTDAGGRGVHGEQIIINGQLAQFLLVLIHEHYLLLVAGEQLGKIRPDGECACYNYPHT